MACHFFAFHVICVRSNEILRVDDEGATYRVASRQNLQTCNQRFHLTMNARLDNTLELSMSIVRVNVR